MGIKETKYHILIMNYPAFSKVNPEARISALSVTVFVSEEVSDNFGPITSSKESGIEAEVVVIGRGPKET